MNNNFTLSVTKFNTIVRDIFNAEELLHNVKIEGEVFGVSQARGAVYFSIKDEASSLPCVCFYPQILNDIKEGDSVTVTGSPNFYVKGGRFSFVVSKAEKVGQGILFQRFLELKTKLEKEGVFDVAHKKQLPKAIKRIGVVTSRDGAVIQDIKNVTWRRNPSIDIVLYNTKVQGIGAENEIAQGIDFFSNYAGVDVVIVARGGGSLEDLSAYNTEVVARATYLCNKPIVSAVGHETDFTIIDFSADLRAPTPSAAAELVTKDMDNLKIVFNKTVERLSRNLQDFVAEKTFALQNANLNLINFAENLLQNKTQKLKVLAQKLSTNIGNFTTEKDFALRLKIADLNKLNPLDILRMGYAKIEQQEKTIGTKQQLDLSTPFQINFVDGSVEIVAKN